MPLRIRGESIRAALVSPTEYIEVEGDMGLGDILGGQLRGSSGNRPQQQQGRTEDLRVSFATATIESLDAAQDIHHGLSLAVPPDAGVIPVRLNVGWIISRVLHDGTGASATTGAVDAVFEVGDTITADSIELRFYAPGRTVGVANPLVVSLLFFPTST